LLFEQVEKKRIITFYFKTNTVDVGECIQPQQHWPKQHSKVVTPQERLLSIIQFFAKVFRRLHHLPMKQRIFKVFSLSTTYLFHYILFILTLGICTDTQIYSPHVSCILVNKALPLFVTLPTPFLITFLLTRQVIE